MNFYFIIGFQLSMPNVVIEQVNDETQVTANA